MPVECWVGGDTNATLQPDNGGHGGDASDEGRECWVGGNTDATSQPDNGGHGGDASDERRS